jgi:hypothetical protein
MSLRDHPQDITYWAATPNGFGGNTFAAPVIVKGRWEDKQIMFFAPNKEEIQSKAVAYLEADVAIGDYIGPGDQTTFPVATSAPTAYPVMQFRKTPDNRFNSYERKAIM